MFTLNVGFICPLVVIDPTNLGAITEWLLKALCLTIFKLSLTHYTCLFTYGNKAGLSA